MRTVPELRCERDDCGRFFEIGEADVGDEVRCAYCGHKQEATRDRIRATPDETQAEADRIADTATPDQQDTDADQAIAVEGGATVTITIQIDVEPRE